MTFKSGSVCLEAISSPIMKNVMSQIKCAVPLSVQRSDKMALCPGRQEGHTSSHGRGLAQLSQELHGILCARGQDRPSQCQRGQVGIRIRQSPLCLTQSTKRPHGHRGPGQVEGHKSR